MEHPRPADVMTQEEKAEILYYLYILNKTIIIIIESVDSIIIIISRDAGADTGGGGYGGSSPPPSRKWAGLQCAHAQRHVITIGLYTLNRCFWRVFRAATDQGRI